MFSCWRCWPLTLGFLHRPAHVVGSREALGWSALWIALAAAFAVIIYFWQGHTATLEFVTGYVLELSLSVDNLFIFLLIFRYFRVPAEYQHKVLLWGILGALVMRGVFIVAGVGLIRRFHWIIYVFGALLVYSGIKLFGQKDAKIQPDKNPVLRLFRRLIPVTENYEGGKFFVRRPALYATPLLVVLLVVETTDVLVHGGFDPGGAGDHPERVYCLYLECFRHPRLALDVFRPGRHDGDV